MSHDPPSEPWRKSESHCLGGFAVVHAYGLVRATADIELPSVVPRSTRSRLLELAGKESALRQKHGIYLDTVSVATPPENYASRLKPLYSGAWPKLSLFALEAHDLARTKLERNFERDRADVAHLARAGHLQAETLRQRYSQEVRPYVIGRESWHDQTLELWLEAYFPRL